MKNLKKMKLNNTQLKIIAVIAMLIDHVGYTFFPEVMAFRAIGRIAFPIFAFLIAEGMLHTSNWKKYALRLLIFALIAEIPFDLFTSGNIIDWEHQNVLFTLLMGALTIVLFNTKHYVGYIGIGAIMALGEIANVDYALFGVLLVFVIYVLNRDDARWGAFGAAVWCLCYGGMEYWGMIAALFLLRYNKERGLDFPALKYGFYAFYPAHLLVLYLLLKLM